MEKPEFLKEAPKYYCLGIMAFLYAGPNSASQREIANHYTDRNDDGDSVYYFERGKLFDVAIEWLRERGMIEIERGPFGPPIVRCSQHFRDLWKHLSTDRDFPLYRYLMVTNGDYWLHQALLDVERTWKQLGISDEDFDDPDREWEPLPLERDDPSLQHTIEVIDETIEDIRKDNGYAANLPEEREAVLDGLSSLNKRLKDGSSISLGYIKKFGIDPLGIVWRRFKEVLCSKRHHHILRLDRP
jgi:hypothetical protein